MPTLVLNLTTRILMPLLLLFSLLLLLRGHHEPGGGFVGGLVAASAFVLVALAEGVDAARRLMRVGPLTLVATGLGGIVLAGIPSPDAMKTPRRPTRSDSEPWPIPTGEWRAALATQAPSATPMPRWTPTASAA